MLPPRITLRTVGESLSFFLDSRDTNNFGFPVYNLGQPNPTDNQDFENPLDLAEIKKYLGSDFILAARIDSGSRLMIDTLQELGFRVFETTLHPKLVIGEDSPLFGHERVQIELADSSEFAQIEEIAKSAFKVSRFHRDPSILDQAADARFAGWVRSSHLDPLKSVYVFRIDGSSAIAGFFVVRRQGQQSFWELTAIASEYRGQGRARIVWESFVSLDVSAGVKVIETNISSENLAVVGLYPKIGFRFARSSQVVHFHSSWIKHSH